MITKTIGGQCTICGRDIITDPADDPPNAYCLDSPICKSSWSKIQHLSFIVRTAIEQGYLPDGLVKIAEKVFEGKDPLLE